MQVRRPGYGDLGALSGSRRASRSRHLAMLDVDLGPARRATPVAEMETGRRSRTAMARASGLPLVLGDGDDGVSDLRTVGGRDGRPTRRTMRRRCEEVVMGQGHLLRGRGDSVCTHGTLVRVGANALGLSPASKRSPSWTSGSGPRDHVPERNVRPVFSLVGSAWAGLLGTPGREGPTISPEGAAGTEARVRCSTSTLRGSGSGGRPAVSSPTAVTASESPRSRCRGRREAPHPHGGSTPRAWNQGELVARPCTERSRWVLVHHR